ncbi:MAG TPA: class I SAM-dependent methyltransferase [Terriglobia bacterium]|nr:class I SAM-dependent methyltransferase [Terriglobia bacterium]
MPIAPRVTREQEAYDEGTVYAESSRMSQIFRHVFDCPNARFCEQYLERQVLAKVRGSCALDYGCGNGYYSQHLLSHGANRVIGIDISPRNIEEAQRSCDRDALTRGAAEFYVMDAHHLTFPNDLFDLVIGRAILHHLEFEKAVREVQRVLKTGGYAIFEEPLRGNPAGKLYRRLTPRARTRDELPLSRAQIRWADGLFGSHHHVFGGFLSTSFGMLTSLLVDSPDNMLLRFADSMDRRIMRTPLRYWMRYAYLVWEK